MQIARVVHHGPDGPEPRVVVASDALPDQFIDLRAAHARQLAQRGATRAAALRIAAATVPGSLTAALETGDRFGRDRGGGDLGSRRGHAGSGRRRVHESGRPSRLQRFHGVRDPFHVRRSPHGHAGRRRAVRVARFVYGKCCGDARPRRRGVLAGVLDTIDFELELGIVIGATVRDLRPENALDAVLGLTVLNDFSARDIQFREMEGRLGPSKGQALRLRGGPPDRDPRRT